MLKRLNFILSSMIPQKLYWHMAGLIHPWDSILEGINDPVKLYRESSNLIKILKKLKLINKNSKVLDIGCGVGRKDLRDLKNKQFDLIFSIIVFQHLPREVFKNYLKESYKHLKVGGKLFFQIPIYKDTKPPEPPRNHPWAIRSYHLNELERILKISGFNQINFYNVSGGRLGGKEDQAFILGVKK